MPPIDHQIRTSGRNSASWRANTAALARSRLIVAASARRGNAWSRQYQPSSRCTSRSKGDPARPQRRGRWRRQSGPGPVRTGGEHAHV